jgi:GNAT superfamily N-acetyltransferase
MLDAFLNWVRKPVLYVRQAGLRALLPRLMRALWNRHRYVVIRKVLTDGDQTPSEIQLQRALKPLEFAVYARCDSADIPRTREPGIPMDWPDPLPRLQELLGRGETLLVARLDGKIVCRSWMFRKDWKALRGGVADSPTRICHCSLRCLPAYRRLGIATQMLAFVHHWARSQGYREVWGYMRRTNRASMGLHCRFGYEVVGFAEFYEILGFHRTRWQRLGGPIRGEIPELPPCGCSADQINRQWRLLHHD